MEEKDIEKELEDDLDEEEFDEEQSMVITLDDLGPNVKVIKD